MTGAIRNPVIPTYKATVYERISIGAFRKVSEFIFTSTVNLDVIPEIILKYIQTLPETSNYAVEVRDVVGGLVMETYYRVGERK